MRSGITRSFICQRPACNTVRVVNSNSISNLFLFTLPKGLILTDGPEVQFMVVMFKLHVRVRSTSL